ncbi:electron transfer flavoprotein subunit beta/FixA family protein [bacterium]|nr:electron transfer flavoprotein subunit beta/FixA family protein [bacterium]
MSKILVPIKRVPDYQAKIKIKPDGSGIQTEGIKWIINPFDEIAVEEAIRIKEARGGNCEVVVTTVGAEAVSEQLRSALAMGADRAIHVLTDLEIDSDFASQVLAAVIRKEAPALVIMGKQAIDSDANQTGQLLACRLNQAQATFASKLVVAEDWSSAEVTREVDGGLETIKISLPAVVTTDLRLNEPRYPSLPNIVKAKKKPLDAYTLESLGLAALGPKVKVLKLEMPAGRKAGVKVQSVQELVERLHHEAKVI